jgi:peptidyl-dipeptidase Dcp
MKRMMLAGTALAVLTGCATQAVEPVMVPPPMTATKGPPAPLQAPVPDNILLAEWTGPYDGVPPWDQVRPDLFPQAIQFGIDELLRETRAIAGNPAPPTFENTIEAMERSGQRLDRVCRFSA